MTTAQAATEMVGTEVLTAHQDELLDVYRDAYSDKISSPFFTESRYWERVEAYASREGFALAETRIDGQLVGYALGYRLPKGSGWWRGFRGDVEPTVISEDGTRTFALTYIMVRRRHRRHGYARALHDTLLNSRTEQRATLLVLPENIAARTAYYSWGWYKIGDLQPYEDAPTYEALLLDLQMKGNPLSR